MPGFSKFLFVTGVLTLLATHALQAQQEKYKTYYLESIVQREKGNYASQYELLRRALEYNPQAPEALFDLAEVAEKGDLMSKEEITELYRKAIKADGGGNLHYKENFAQYAVRTGNYEEAMPILQELTKNNLKRDMAYQTIGTIYESQGNYDKLLECLEEWKQKGGDSETVNNAKLKTLDRLGRYDDEIKLLDQLIAEGAGIGDSYYEIARAEALMMKDDTVAAWQAYERLAAKDPGNPSIQMFPVYYYQHTQNAHKMSQAVETVILNNEQPTELRASLMKNLIASYDQAGMEKRIVAIFDTLMEQPLKARNLPDMYAEYLAGKHKKNAAFLPCMKKILEIDPSDDQARLVVIDDALQKRNYDDAISKCKEGMLLNPTKLLYYHIAGGALFQTKKYKEALEIFGQGMEHIGHTKDEEVLSNFYSSYADALHEAGQKKRAYEYYDSALVHNPSNIMCLNNYAYFLSVSGTQLPKALKMSETVLKIEPDNPTYIDTYAWIRFQLGDYEQARTYIEDALKKTRAEDEDPSLYEHAGDIYAQLGLKKEAKKAWKKAQQLGEQSDILKKKIKTGKYIKQEKP